EENLKQADLPDGSVPIEPEGTAPGFYVDDGSSVLFALPGVPWEMKAMLDKIVVPLLAERAGGSILVTRHVLVMGLGESATHQKIADIVEGQSNPTIAFLAGSGQVRVRITAKAATEEEAEALIAPVEEQVRARLGEAAVPGGRASVADALGDLLRARRATVAVAESLTGGGLGAALSETDGASDYFLGSLVVYAASSKRDVAGIDAAVLEEHGAVSAQTAEALAEGAARRFGADLGLATTGVAGPAEQEGHPVGTIFVAAFHDGTREVRRVRGYGDRQHVRALAVTSALDLGRRVLQRADEPV
ncbi:MAG: nicotinamide-nucleotide amidohydrolase family protein, partial [Actinomycetota bacterium]